MKKKLFSVFAIIALAGTSYAATDKKTEEASSKKQETKDCTIEITAPCRGSAMVDDGRGNLIPIEMETVNTRDAFECSEIFGTFLNELKREGLRVVTFTNMYGYN
ncbi:hypothetical protein AAEO56_10625 [Flavobacterium sp. DGU11]|uniref:Uncharacterized protein n=1 Tax=Flavobacterium arundinis TaxID=3139143 RepID=A0ABU9HX36_9FLAO